MLLRARSTLPHQTGSSVSHSLGLPHQPRSFWRVHLFLLRPRLPLPQDAQAPPTRPIHKSSLAGPHVHHTPQVLKAQSQPIEAREGNAAMGEVGGGCAHHQRMPRHATMTPNILGQLSEIELKNENLQDTKYARKLWNVNCQPIYTL